MTDLVERMKRTKLLLPYQSRAIALSHQHQLFVEEKSRRTGLTYGFAADAVLTASAVRGAQDFFYIAYNLDMTREFIGYCADFSKAFQRSGKQSEFLFDDGSEQGIKAFRIDFPAGKSIVALSSKPRSLRGKQGVVLIDEAAFHDQLEELLKAAIALHMWGGRTIVISTHDGADNPFNLLIEDIRAGRREGHVERLTLEDAMAQGLYRRICLRTGQTWSEQAEKDWESKLRRTYGDAAEEELDVVPARGSGTYLPRATIEAAMAQRPVLRLTCKDDFSRRDLDWRKDFIDEWLESNILPLLEQMSPDRYVYFGQDFARSSDLSAIAVGQYDEMANLDCRFMIEMRNTPFREQEQILRYICDNVALFAAAKMDARGNGQQLAETMVDLYGEDRIEAVMASDKTYLAMMPRLKARIEDRTIIIPRADAVIEDLRCIKQVRGVPKIPERSKVDKSDGAKAKRHGDTAIALMHLVAAADEDVGPVDLHTTGERRATAEDSDLTDIGFGTVRRRHADDISGFGV